MKIIPDKVILDQKNSYKVNFEYFHFLNKVGQNTFKNTPENDLDTFFDITSHITSKYRPDFLGNSKIAGPDRF